MRVPRDLAQGHILHALPQTNEAGSQAFWGFPGGSAVKNPPVMEETRVQSLDREDPLEKGMATHSPVFLPGKSHGQRSQTGYSPRGRKE